MLKFQKLGAHIQRCSNAIKAPLSKVPDSAKQLAQNASQRARAAASHLLAEAGKQLNRADRAWRGGDPKPRTGTNFPKADTNDLAHPIKARFTALDPGLLNQTIQQAESQREKLQANSEALSTRELNLKKETLLKQDKLAATKRSLRGIERHALSKFPNLPDTPEQIEALRFSDTADQKKHSDYLQLKQTFDQGEADVELCKKQLQAVKNQKALLHIQIAKVDCDLRILRTRRELCKARLC